MILQDKKITGNHLLDNGILPTDHTELQVTIVRDNPALSDSIHASQSSKISQDHDSTEKNSSASTLLSQSTSI